MKRNLILAALACTAMAAENTPVTEIGLRKLELLEAAQKAKPGTIVSDPAAAAAMQHIASQLKLLIGDGSTVPDDNPLAWMIQLGNNQGTNWTFGFHGKAEMPSAQGGRQEALVICFDIGEAEEQVRKFVDAIIEPDDKETTEIAGLKGRMIDGDEGFVSVQDGRLVIGTPSEIATHLGRRDQMVSGERPAQGSWQGANLMARLQKMREFERELEVLFALFPSWIETPPSATISAGVEGETWVGSLSIKNIGPTLLRQPAPVFAAGHGGEPAVQLIAGIDMDIIRLRLSPDRLESFGIGPGRERDMLLDVLDAISGDLALSATWQFGPLPPFRLDLGLADSEAFGRLLADLSKELGPMLQPQEAANYNQSWQVPTPVGIIHIGLSADRLIVCSLPQLPDPNAEVVTTMDVKAPLRLDIDLPKLGQVLLPMAYGAMAGANEPLIRNPLNAMRHLRWPLSERIQQRQEKPLPGSISAVFSEEDGQSHWAFNQVRRSFPGASADPGAWLDSHCAVYLPSDPDTNADQMLLVVKTDAGFVVFTDDWSRQPPAAIDEAAFAARTKGMEAILGRAAADLETIPVPEIPTFSAKWLPPLPTLIAHLPKYHLEARQAEDGTVLIDERGLPLLSTTSGFMSVGLWAMERQLGRQYQWRMRDRQQQAIEAKHPGLRQGMQVIARALSEARDAGELPDKLSGLVASGHLDLAQTAQLFNGRPAASAEELDRCGLYNKDEEYGTWQVGVGDGWVFQANRWGGVDLNQSDKEVPGIPDDIKTQAPAGEADF